MLIFILIFLKSECERLANEALLLEHTQRSSVAAQQRHLFIPFVVSAHFYSPEMQRYAKGLLPKFSRSQSGPTGLA